MINIIQNTFLALAVAVSSMQMPPEPKMFYSYERQTKVEENISWKIRKYAKEYGADPNLALNVACAESCTRNKEGNVVFNPKAKNPNSTASGVYQFIEGTWNSMCEGDVFNEDDNVKCATRILAKESGIRHWEASRKEGFGNGWENKPYDSFKVEN